MAEKKTYEYCACIIDDRGFINDPEYLAMLNEQGREGWRHRHEQSMGANRLVVLLERETIHDGEATAKD